MTYYHTILMRFQHYYQQLKCTLVFLGFLLPTLTIIVWVRLHIEALFHILLLTIGWLTYTFFEYMLHRFWQHKRDASHNIVLSKPHLDHHLHPTEIRIMAWQRISMLLILTACCIVT